MTSLPTIDSQRFPSRFPYLQTKCILQTPLVLHGGPQLTEKCHRCRRNLLRASQVSSLPCLTCASGIKPRQRHYTCNPLATYLSECSHRQKSRPWGAVPQHHSVPRSNNLLERHRTGNRSLTQPFCTDESDHRVRQPYRAPHSKSASAWYRLPRRPVK
jgi:hypothetical protein